ncbi:ATP-binding protein [Roseomonas elaeocarpi]|uniref:Winged helix-turn-helix domain-containing protein n=1 Tax=Roseomonas elaeocarpi TaxID=907779 RepID=A0ABV6JN30_9PROT
MREATLPPQSQRSLAAGSVTIDLEGRQALEAGQPLQLGSRAFDILALLVEHAGEVVSKEEIFRRVWGDLHVEEANLRVHVTALRKALGDGQGERRFIVNVPGRGYSFVGAAAPQVVPPPAAPAEATKSRGLRAPPRQRTRVVGRDALVADLAKNLLLRRFISIVGPGGMGKTTVALAVAAVLEREFPGAIAFVDLASLQDPRMVQSAVAGALNLPIRSDNESESIVRALEETRTLLILDNCEHVIDNVALLAELIHARAPEVYLLATTREPLRVAGEHVHRLAALASPPPAEAITAAEVAAYPAAELFIERASAQAGGFALSDDSAAAVSEICRRLDGLALAIELAAGRIDSFGVKGLAKRLDQRFEVLNRGRRTALPRQQTLRMTLDWSHDLLLDTEKVLLRRLSVFAGSFTFEAAQAVACGTDIPTADRIEHLADLVLKSLVVAESVADGVRYRLLDTTRAYALERLAEHGEAPMFVRHHALHFLQVLEQAIRDRPDETMLGFRPDLDNVRAALNWAFSDEGEAAVAVRLASASAFLFIDHSLLAECATWTARALEILPEAERGSHREMELSTSYAMPLLFTRGNLEEVRVALERALSLAEALGDAAYQARTLDGLFTFHLRGGHFRSMFTVGRQAEALERARDLPSQGGADWMLGLAHHFAGNHRKTREHLERAIVTLPRKRSVDVLRMGVDQRVNVGNALARSLWMQGFADRARVVAARNVEEAEAFGDPVTLAVALMWTLPIALWSGEIEVAEQWLARLIECSARGGLTPSRFAAQGFQVAVAIHRGDPAAGLTLLEESIARLRGVNSRLYEVVLLTHLAEGLTAAGRHCEALLAIEEALAAVEARGETVYTPNLLHLKAEVMLAGGSERALAEAVLLEALDWARRQGAMAYELRILMSLVSLHAGQERAAEMAAEMRALHGRFSEGFDTADLRRAAEILERGASA